MRTIGLKGVQQSLCCLVGYAIFYYLTREASATNWQLTSGLRFAAFLFLPYRLWPAIFLGDMAGALAYRWNVVLTYGLPWFLVSFIGTPAAAAIPSALLRTLHFQTWKLELSRKVIGLLQAAGLASLLNSVVGIAAMDVIHYAGDVKRMDGLPVWFLSVFLLGNFLGMLMVLPAIMTVRLLRTHRSTIAAHEARKLSAGFWRACIWSAVALLCLLAVNRTTSLSSTQTITALLMIGPAVALTYKQGWNGAIAASILANIALQLTVRHDSPIGVFQAQVLMALVCTALLLFGARMTEDRIRDAVKDQEHKKVLRAARSNLMLGESRIRETASLVERAFSSLQRFIDHTALQLAPIASPNAIATLKWTSAGLLAHEARHTAGALHLAALESSGLRMALITGPISQAMRHACIDFPVRVSSYADALSHDAQIALYRAAHDVVLRMASEFNASRISVRLRVAPDRSFAALVIKATPGHGDAPDLPPYHADMEQLSGLATSFQGIFHDRRRRRRPVVSMLLRNG